MKRVIPAILVILAVYLVAIHLVAGSSWDSTLIQRYRDAAQLLAPVLVILSAGVIWQQLRLNFEVQSRTMFDALTQDMKTMQSMIIASPEVYPYFYQGKSLEGASPEEKYLILAIAEARLDHIDGFLLRAATYKAAYARAEKGQEKYIDSWVLDMFSASPVMQEFLFEHQKWYSSRLIRICQEAQNLLGHEVSPGGNQAAAGKDLKL